MDRMPSEAVSNLAAETLGLAVKSVGNGTLVPFLVVRGAAIILPGRTLEEITKMARAAINTLPETSSTYAFAYDGYLTLDGERTDAMFVEAGERGGDGPFVFAQRYRPKRFLRPAKAVGKPKLLVANKPRLTNSAG